MDIDDIACEIGDEVRDFVHRLIEDALYNSDLDDKEREAVADELWNAWKDWV